MNGFRLLCNNSKMRNYLGAPKTTKSTKILGYTVATYNVSLRHIPHGNQINDGC